MKIIFIFFIVFIASNSFALKKSYENFSKALVSEKEGNYDMAMEYYKKAIEIDPDPFLYKQALNLALQTGRIKEAKEYSQYIVSSDSSSAENWFLYGNSLWASGEVEEAKKAFEKTLEIDPSYADAYYQLSSLNLNTPAKAIAYLKKFLELKPDYKAEIFYQIALIYQTTNDEKNMMEYIKKSIEEDEFYLKPRYFLASYYESKKELKKAIKEYEKLIEIDSKNTELLNHMGELYLSSDIAKAMDYFNMSVEIDSSNPVALYWLSAISESKKDYEKAISYLKNSRDLETNPSTGLKLSYYYTLVNNYSQAINLLEKLHLKWPENWEISYFLALGYEDRSRFEEAYSLLSEVVIKNPENEDAILQLAVVCEKLNKVACFEENFRKLLAKKPDNSMVLNYLGYSLIDRGLKIDEAIGMVQKALEKEPENGAYLDSLGWGFYKKGEYNKALENLEKSVKIINNDPIIWEHLGELWERFNNSNKAWLAYKISLALNNSKKEELRKKIKKLDKENLTFDSIYKYLDTFSLKDANFSSFLKVTANFKGRKIKIDGIIYSKGENDFGISLIGPLMMPVWKMEYLNGVLNISELKIDDINKDFLNLWAKDIFLVLKRFFSGEIISPPYLKYSSKLLKKEDMEIKFPHSSLYVDKIKFKGERKFEIIFKNFELVNNYLIPTLLELNAPYVKIAFEIDASKINIQKTNDLLKNWK